jgi:hypothetical protein
VVLGLLRCCTAIQPVSQSRSAPHIKTQMKVSWPRFPNTSQWFGSTTKPTMHTSGSVAAPQLGLCADAAQTREWVKQGITAAHRPVESLARKTLTTCVLSHHSQRRQR